jgi:PPM family protein phosphatase
MSADESSKEQSWFPRSPFSSPPDSPPPEAAVQVEFGARSRRGSMRSVNDDHYLILRLGRHEETLLTSLPESDVPKRFDEYGYGMVIADGIGPTGEAASRLAITSLVHLAISFGRWNVRVDESVAEEMMDRARRYYRGVDSTLLQAGHDSPRGLQSTLTAVYSAGTELFYMHVGHSRAYVFRDNRLVQLTRDHTVASERPGGRTIVDVSASARDFDHIVTQRLGGPSSDAPRIDVERFGLLDGDVVLMCTNGLTDAVEDRQIADRLGRPGTADDLCRELVDLAFGAGSKDDVTALVARYHIPA